MVYPRQRCVRRPAAQCSRCGHTVFEADGQAAYLIDAATAAQIEEISKKIEVLGGKVELAMKKLAE